MGRGFEDARHIVQIELHNSDPDFSAGTSADVLNEHVERAGRTGIPITTKVRIAEPVHGPLTRLARQAEEFRKKNNELFEEFMLLVQKDQMPAWWFRKFCIFVKKRIIDTRSRTVAGLLLEAKADALRESKLAITRALASGEMVMAEKRKWLEFEPVEGVERRDLAELIQLAKRVMIFVYRLNPQTRELELLRDCKVM